MLLGEVTELELAHVVSRVRAAVNRCEHEPSYTSDDTITKKLLAVLAKTGVTRQSSSPTSMRTPSSLARSAPMELLMRPPAALTQAGWRHQGRQILLQPPQRRKSRLSARPKRPRDRHRPSTRKLLAASTQNVELMSVRKSLEKGAS